MRLLLGFATDSSLLDMNRLMSGNVRLDVGAVDAGLLLQTTMQSLQPAASA